MNILILGAGTRNLLIRYFKASLKDKGQVIAADCSPFAPALYEADESVLVPPYTSSQYLDDLLQLCKRKNISGLLSLIDPEVRILSENRKRFQENGITVVGCDQGSGLLADNKLCLAAWLKEHGYAGVKTWEEPSAFLRDLKEGCARFPVVVKPVCGSASIGVTTVSNTEELTLRFQHEKNLFIQEQMDGMEIGADVYADLISGEAVSVFTKKKIRMRAGETDKAVSFHDPKLVHLLTSFTQEAGFRGPLDMDLFQTGDGDYRILEVNARFGGGYPHAHALGCDHVSMIVKNITGETNSRLNAIYKTGVVMMKHSEITLVNSEKGKQKWMG